MQVVTQLPQSTVECICFSLVCYFISGLTRTASCFFIYLLVSWSASNCIGVFVCGGPLPLMWLRVARCVHARASAQFHTGSVTAPPLSSHPPTHLQPDYSASSATPARRWCWRIPPRCSFCCSWSAGRARLPVSRSRGGRLDLRGRRGLLAADASRLRSPPCPWWCCLLRCRSRRMALPSCTHPSPLTSSGAPLPVAALPSAARHSRCDAPMHASRPRLAARRLPHRAALPSSACHPGCTG